MRIKNGTMFLCCLVLALSTIILIPAISGCTSPSPEPTSSPAPTQSPTPAPTPEVIELKWAGFDPPQAATVAGIMTPWVEAIEKDSDGRVKITLYPGESLGKGPDQYEMVKNRVADIANVMPSFTPGLFPLAEIIELPHLYPSGEMIGRVCTELMNKYAVDTELKDIKLLWVLGMTNQQPQSTQKLEKLEDWKGLKCMAEGKIDAQVIESLGGSPVPMPMPEVFTGLQTGLIQAVNMSWEGSIAFKIHEATKYRVKYDMYGKGFLVMMNKDVWNNLPQDIQDVFEKHGGPDQGALSGTIFENINADIFNGPIAEYDKNVGNPGIYILPAEEADRWTQATSTVIDNWITEKQGEGLPGKEIVDEAKSLVQKYSK